MFWFRKTYIGAHRMCPSMLERGGDRQMSQDVKDLKPQVTISHHSGGSHVSPLSNNPLIVAQKVTW